MATSTRSGDDEITAPLLPRSALAEAMANPGVEGGSEAIAIASAPRGTVEVTWAPVTVKAVQMQVEPSA